MTSKDIRVRLQEIRAEFGEDNGERHIRALLDLLTESNNSLRRAIAKLRAGEEHIAQLWVAAEVDTRNISAAAQRRQAALQNDAIALKDKKIAQQRAIIDSLKKDLAEARQERNHDLDYTTDEGLAEALYAIHPHFDTLGDKIPYRKLPAETRKKLIIYAGETRRIFVQYHPPLDLSDFAEALYKLEPTYDDHGMTIDYEQLGAIARAKRYNYARRVYNLAYNTAY